MSIRYIVLSTLGILLVVFTGLNWGAMTEPTSLSLVFAQIQAPLGLLMLGMLLVVAAGATLLVTLHQTRMLMQARRMEKDLAAQRELADKAELSRFTLLQTHLDQQLTDIRHDVERQHAHLEQVIRSVQQSVNHELGDEARSLAAQLGQMEDRLNRWLEAVPTSPHGHALTPIPSLSP